jgi:hypothetical protein
MGRRFALAKACVAMGELSVRMVVPMAMKKLQHRSEYGNVSKCS